MSLYKVGVIGLGHLGRSHALAYQKIPQAQLVSLFDTDQARAQNLARELNVSWAKRLGELLRAVDAVSVAVPTSVHHRIAMECLQRGIHVLVEKPIATTLEEADELISVAQHSGVVLQVGHIERFNPAFLQIAQMPLMPMFIESHRLAPFTPRGADVAVILDLMIHDIDLALTLVPKEIVAVEAAGVSVISESEDIANARVTFSNGAVANLTASRITPKPMRKMRLFQRDTYISIDFLDRSVEIYRLTDPGSQVNEKDQPLGALAQTALLARGRSVICERPRLKKKDALLSELAAFLKSIHDRQRPVVSGEDGRRALALALRVLRRLQEHAMAAQEPQKP